MPMTPNTIHDVWLRVDRRGPDECWPYTGARTSSGYGYMRLYGKHTRAHRIAYEAATGAAPGDLCVLHRCDNPPCCNPAHLFLGTAGDNNRDTAAKGRTRSGAAHPSAKLSAADVRDIRARRAAGEQGTALAAEFAVTPQLVSLIVNRRIWGNA